MIHCTNVTLMRIILYTNVENVTRLNMTFVTCHMKPKPDTGKMMIIWIKMKNIVAANLVVKQHVMIR